MSVASGQNEPPEEIKTVKKKVLGCFKGVKLLQTVVVTVCFVIVVQQISSCINKLIDAPVTTYTHFDFNKTIAYPSVTFCREPAYKFDKMLDYNLYSHPRYTSVWLKYNFSISLDDLWEDITYTAEDFFVQYGLDGSPNNVEIVKTIGFVYGHCYTLVPKTRGTHASKATGYSITLKHSAEDMETMDGLLPPGYHVYVHYSREPFTGILEEYIGCQIRYRKLHDCEVEVYNGGLVQYLYVHVGENLEVKLTVDEYLKISGEDDPCTNMANYSANICTAKCVWDMVGEEAGCSGPWMSSSDWPRCNNYTLMRSVISAYMNSYQHHQCEFCPRFCNSYLYNSFVTDRKTLYVWNSETKMWHWNTDAALQSQLYIYFNSMMVSVYEERFNYDWNLFVSDLGGSVGFLLGLSVISLLKIFGKTWQQFLRPYIKWCRKGKGTSIDGSSTTVVATYPYIVKDDWGRGGN